ncbi:Glutathione S-transferase A1 [Microtus ochrogaster]|uniref:Glutathione S-transferase n=1 Tax=Microtus ochrogaster TaxID=79684 RepID=A0A8J6GXU2_MICOH|nr:Glutathione S-transferase A1 [Microtus ochrogaster]
MAGKPVLHYFNGRGRMECIRWLLAAAGVEFEEKFIEAPADMEKLIKDGRLMFQQVPMVEIDGMRLVQTRAILNYIATKYNLYGKDAKERALIDMYTEGILDLTEMMLQVVISLPDQREAKISLIKEKTKNRYLPAYEKVLKSHGQDYLVGNRLTRVDIHLLEVLLYVEELDSSLLAPFPLLKGPDGGAQHVDGEEQAQLKQWNNMYTEGTLDLTEMMLKVVKCSPYQREAKISLVKDKTKNRYLSAFEKEAQAQARSNSSPTLVDSDRESHTSPPSQATPLGPVPGLQHELIPVFQDTYRVLIKVKPDPDIKLLYLYGLREERAFTLVIIVSLACKLRMKRNRGK